MRIALLAPLIAPIREPQVGGVGTFLTDLALGLQDAGHEVELFAASGSAFPGLHVVDTGVDATELAGTLFRPLGSPRDDGRRAAALADAAFEAVYARIRSDRYDIVHNHAFDAPAIEHAPRVGRPVVHTLHLPPDPLVSDALRRVRERPGDAGPPCVATVSPAQRTLWEPHNRIDAVLRPGVPTARMPWSEGAGRGLIVAGRISPEKGVLEAVEIVRGTGRPLVVAGGPYDPRYAEEVERIAAVADDVVLVGPLPRSELWRLMARAAALLFPVLWEEPFGLVPAEAQACGCPVIGFRTGPLAEIVVEGVTGTIVERHDIEGARRALSRIGEHRRVACRRHAEASLDLRPTLDAHLALYRRVLDRVGCSSG